MGVKTRPYKIQRLTNTDADFYATVGPLLSRREIVKELGSPVWDDDGKVWFVATPEDGQPIACAALSADTLCSLWVSPEARQNSTGTTLVLRVLSEAGGAEVSVVATEASRGLFEECGFREYGARGRYTLMRTNHA